MNMTGQVRRDGIDRRRRRLLEAALRYSSPFISSGHRRRRRRRRGGEHLWAGDVCTETGLCLAIYASASSTLAYVLLLLLPPLAAVLDRSPVDRVAIGKGR